MTEVLLRQFYRPWNWKNNSRSIKLKGIGLTTGFNMCRDTNRVIYLSFYIDKKPYKIAKFQ